jgi:predicted nucleic acid-binding protein
VTSYVLDASVAAKWFLPQSGETLSREARDVLREFAGGRLRLAVPDLFWPEFGNVQWKAVRAGRISQHSAEESIQAMEGMGIATAPSRRLLRDAFAIAARFQRSVYDGIYLALAAASGAPLVTADERLVNAVAARLPVRWLGAL